jgi:Protein of unknown function (DUF3060)
MKSFYSPNTLLLIAALPLAMIPMASGAGLEIDKNGDAHVITDNGQTLDLKTLTTLPLKLLFLGSESGLEINSNEQGEVIVDSNKVLDIQASGKDVAVTGNGNTIHIHGDLPRLALIGQDNVVELDRVGTIALIGAQNRVSYLSGLGSDGPTVDRVGTNNTVTVREAQNASQLSPTAAAQTNVNPNQSLVIDGSNQLRTETINGEEVTVSGSNNRITLKGRVKELLVEGSNNEITAENLGHVTFMGSNNLVKYGSPIETSVASSIRGGSNNAIQRWQRRLSFKS